MWQRLVGGLADHVPPTLRGATWQLSWPATVAVVVGLVVAVGAAVLVASPDAPEMITPRVVAGTTAVDVTVSDPPDQGTRATTSGVVVIDVAGLVAAPGVYELPLGSRVIDALERAGGAQPGVDTSTLNLARVLVDGEQIAVGVPPAADAGDHGEVGGASSGGRLDLNLASEVELDALPGVGPVLAGRIVAWREEHGRFTAVEELLEVSGIGTATLADLADLVRVG